MKFHLKAPKTHTARGDEKVKVKAVRKKLRKNGKNHLAVDKTNQSQYIHRLKGYLGHF